MSYNAYAIGYKLPPTTGPYIFDNTIMAAKVDGSGKEVSRLVFGTGLLKKPSSGPYSVTVNGATSTVPSVHNVDWIDSDNTIGNFGLYLQPGNQYYDSNLYFYLTKAADQKLTVNNETFTVSWDDAKQAFTVKNESGAVVSTTGTDNSTADEKPETEAKTEIAVKDGEATVIVALPDEGAQVGNEPERLVVNVDTEGEKVDKITVEIPKEVMALESGSKSDIEIRSEVANVLLPEKAVAALARMGESITVKAARNEDSTYTFTVAAGERTLETLDGGIKAVIPSEDASPGTVAVLVHEDGTEEVVKKSYGKDGVVSVPLTGSATIKIVDNAKSFNDVAADQWYAEAVAFASGHELFNGTGGGKFSPDTSMTRGMLVTVLHRLENAPDATGELFADVDGGAWYAEAVIWASANDIVNGTGNGFAPNHDVTREQIVVMIYRYYVSIVGDGVLDVPPSDAGDLSAFPDAGNVSAWAEDAVIWAVGIGLIQGRDSGLAPQGTATRAEVATILQRFVEQMT
jgi:hypothetical protein